MGESVDIAAKLKLLASAENRLVLLGVQVYFLCCVSPVVRCGAVARPGGLVDYQQNIFWLALAICCITLNPSRTPAHWMRYVPLAVVITTTVSYNSIFCIDGSPLCGAAVRPGLVGVGGLTIPSNLLEFLLLQPPVVYRHPR